MIDVEPLTMTIGSEVRGIDLNHITPTASDHIYALLMDRGVLVFRDQNLSHGAHVALAESFGPLTELHPLYPHVEGFPIARIRTDAAHPPESEVWHSDLSCRTNPPFVSVLRDALLPPVGGDTLWADLRTVHDSLPETLRDELRGAEAEHTLEQGFRFVESYGQTDRAKSLAASNATDRSRNVAIHPVIVSHPATGRPLVYVNESFTTRIINMEPDRSATVLRELYTAVRNPRFQVRIRWRPGTVVIWDNWATQHFASGDFHPFHEREVQRVTVLADSRSRAFSLAE